MMIRRMIRLTIGIIIRTMNRPRIIMRMLTTFVLQNVKNGSELLDRLLKDIVTECKVTQSS